jgi:hypothetical protein
MPVDSRYFNKLKIQFSIKCGTVEQLFTQNYILYRNKMGGERPIGVRVHARVHLFVCKHLLGMAIRYNFALPPLEAKQVTTWAKKKERATTQSKKMR